MSGIGNTDDASAMPGLDYVPEKMILKQ
jgi:hypothetical protein